MGKYNFDKLIDRKGTKSIKFDSIKDRGMAEDVLPLWVADMDFETAPKIKEAIIKRAEHGIYGYTKADEEFYTVLVDWMKKRHGWVTEKDWYVPTPGVVFALNMTVKALTEEGDAVIIQRPVYHPFTSVIEQNNRKLINSPLIYKDNGYEMDMETFEQKIIENQVKLFILCNPHNPVGRVWSKEELTAIGNICVKHGVLVIADEIHQDFIFKGYKHNVFADIDERFREITITCTSPSKTFNLAGLQISNIIISNDKLRDMVKQEINNTGYHEPSLFGMIANLAAYTHGEEWLEEMKEYLEGNIKYLKKYIEENIPKIKMTVTEGTYLVWLDFNEFQLTEEELEVRITDKAKLWLNTGTMFGPEGKGFQRLNIATSRRNVEKAVTALEKAFSEQ